MDLSAVSTSFSPVSPSYASAFSFSSSSASSFTALPSLVSVSASSPSAHQSKSCILEESNLSSLPTHNLLKSFYLVREQIVVECGALLRYTLYSYHEWQRYARNLLKRENGSGRRISNASQGQSWDSHLFSSSAVPDRSRKERAACLSLLLSCASSPSFFSFSVSTVSFCMGMMMF